MSGGTGTLKPRFLGTPQKAVRAHHLKLGTMARRVGIYGGQEERSSEEESPQMSPDGTLKTMDDL